MSWACKGFTSTLEIKTFDSNVKQKVLNDEKLKKKSKFDTCLCHLLPFHYDINRALFHFLTFQGTESSGQFIFVMLE